MCPPAILFLARGIELFYLGDHLFIERKNIARFNI